MIEYLNKCKECPTKLYKLCLNVQLFIISVFAILHVYVFFGHYSRWTKSLVSFFYIFFGLGVFYVFKWFSYHACISDRIKLYTLIKINEKTVCSKMLELYEYEDNYDIEQKNIKNLYHEYINGNLVDSDKRILFAIPIFITFLLLFEQSDFHTLVSTKALILYILFLVISFAVNIVYFLLSININIASIENFSSYIKSWTSNKS